MTIAAIIAWLLMNLPELIALIRKLFDTERRTFQQREALRLELSAVIQRKGLTRRERRLLAKSILLREERFLVELELSRLGLS